MPSYVAQQQFSVYGPSHLAVLTLFVIGAVVLIRVGRRQPEERVMLIGRILAGLLMTVFATALFFKLTHPDIQTSIPLQLCDIAELVAAYGLWTQRRWAVALTYYWGLLLSSQALLTPDIGTPAEGAPDFPHHLFITFFALHVLVVWSAIYVTWVCGFRPDWRTWRFAVVLTLGWVAFTLVFNEIAGTNYGYLNAKPAAGSVLDPLGPWPLYLVIEIFAVIAVWALMTWPWQRVRKLSATAPPPPAP